MNKLFVHYRKQLVGTLTYDTAEQTYSFDYSKDWIDHGFEVSPSMKFNTIITNSSIKSFVENLLPEGNGLEELSQFLQISKSNKYAMLKEIGLETTGALTFSDTADYLIKTNFREVPLDELINRISNREYNDIKVWDNKPRLSVAGIQEKLPIIFLDNKFGFGEGDLCSTHIIKFNKKGENVVLNEYISLRLAKRLGFNVTKVEYIKLGEEYVLFVERFDRNIINKSYIERTHLIDSVQALGLPVSFKYERNLSKNVPSHREGVSFPKLFALAQEAEIPALFKEQIILFSMMNLIFGNSDAHGKNISFFVSNKGLRVAPFYDVVNVTMYDNYEQDMAMAIDDEFEFRNLKEYDFTEFFELNEISTNDYFIEFKKLTIKLENALNKFDFIDEKIHSLEEKFIKKYKSNIIKRVNDISEIINRVNFNLPFDNENGTDFITDNIKEVKKILAKDFIDGDDKGNMQRYIEKLKQKLIKKIH